MGNGRLWEPSQEKSVRHCGTGHQPGGIYCKLGASEGVAGLTCLWGARADLTQCLYESPGR